MSIERAIGFYPSIIQLGTLYLSNDRSSNSLETNNLIDRLNKINNSTSFTEKLAFWCENKICITHIWVGDISSLVESNNKENVLYKTEFGPPSPDVIFTIYPSTAIEVVEINLKNIGTASEFIGSFDTFKRNYLRFIEDNKDSSFLLNRLRKDQQEVANKFKKADDYLFYLEVDESHWSTSFREGCDTLNLNDYKVWFDKEIKVSNLDDSKGFYRTCTPPYNLYFINLPSDVINAAKGHLNSQIAPFLDSMVNKYSEKLLPNNQLKDSQPIKDNNYKFQSTIKPSMKIETNRLDSITQALENILIDSKYEFRNRWEGGLESPFMQIYKHYSSLTERWRDTEDLVLNPYTLETEIKENFLIADDNNRINYIKLLNYKIASLTVIEEETERSLDILQSDINNGLVDPHEIIDFYRNEVSTFVYGIKDVLNTIRRVKNIVNENIEIFNSKSNEPEQNIPSHLGAKLTWTCKPAVAGYIISELIRAGYLAPPITGGEMSLSKLAGICNQLFEFTDHTPSVASWRNVVDRERNTLPYTKRVKLNLPDSDQLS